jgi:hypothetical protein
MPCHLFDETGMRQRLCGALKRHRSGIGDIMKSFENGNGDSLFVTGEK